MYFLKFLFNKKKNKKGKLFHAVLYDGDALLSPLQLIVETSNSLKKRAKVFVMNLNTEKKIITKYYLVNVFPCLMGSNLLSTSVFRWRNVVLGYDCYR